MSRAKWPDEAPVFYDMFFHLNSEAIEVDAELGYIHLRHLQCDDKCSSIRTPNEVKPLTPAAEDILAIARGDS